jgi:hypothetical protein
MKKVLFGLISFFLCAFPVFAEPASISFDPIEIQSKTNEIITVDVNIYTADTPVASTDVWVRYDPRYLEPLVDTTKKGNLFNTIDTKIVSPGNLYVYGVQQDTSQSESKKGKLATLSFKALSSGQTQLSFECVPFKKQTSQIIKADSQLTNIISCPATVTHTAQVTISADSSVLGENTRMNSIMRIASGTGAIIIALLTGYLFMKYQRLRKRA